MPRNFPPPPYALLQKFLPPFLSVRRNEFEWMSSRWVHLGGALLWIVLVLKCAGMFLMAGSSNLPSQIRIFPLVHAFIV